MALDRARHGCKYVKGSMHCAAFMVDDLDGSIGDLRHYQHDARTSCLLTIPVITKLVILLPQSSSSSLFHLEFFGAF